MVPLLVMAKDSLPKRVPGMMSQISRNREVRLICVKEERKILWTSMN